MYNILYERFINVRKKDKVDKCSIIDLLQDNSILYIMEDYNIFFPILMILLSSVYRSYRNGNPPKNIDEWIAMRGNFSEEAISYLSKNRKYFDFFSNDFFLHYEKIDPKKINANEKEDIEDETPSGNWSSIDMTACNGNNNLLYDKLGHNRKYNNEEKIKNMLSHCLFGSASPTRNMLFNGEGSEWAAKSGSKLIYYMKMNKMCGQFNILSLCLIGETFLDTIWLNILSLKEIGNMELGVPVWETKPTSFSNINSIEYKNLTSTFLGQLFPVNRIYKYTEENLYYMSGFSQERKPEDNVSPFIPLCEIQNPQGTGTKLSPIFSGDWVGDFRYSDFFDDVRQHMVTIYNSNEEGRFRTKIINNINGLCRSGQESLVSKIKIKTFQSFFAQKHTKFMGIKSQEFPINIKYFNTNVLSSYDKFLFNLKDINNKCYTFIKKIEKDNFKKNNKPSGSKEIFSIKYWSGINDRYSEIIGLFDKYAENNDTKNIFHIYEIIQNIAEEIEFDLRFLMRRSPEEFANFQKFINKIANKYYKESIK